MIMTTMVMVMAMVQGHDGREHLRVPLGRRSPVCTQTGRHGDDVDGDDDDDDDDGDTVSRPR